jgi:L-amino acid N-acyltransferase YncA
VKRGGDRDILQCAQRTAEINAAYETASLEPNPHAPTIAIYLRPAEERDVPGITDIYNHYVRNSIIPEDQEPVNERDIRGLLNDVCSDALPFIVAILGQPPKDPSSNAKKFNSRYPTVKPVAQSEGRVVGFTYVNAYYGLSFNASGRSRYTGNLQIYVHHDYVRKGIGGSLLDRILMCTCSTHTARGGYDWVEPKDPLEARIYCDGGGNGLRRYHQLVIERPIERNLDPDHEWLKRWLNKFFFKQTARLLALARSRAPESGRWLDVLTFQKSATLDGEIVGCI